MDKKEKWRAAVIARYGTWEAFQDAMRESAAKSKKNLGGKGGFASMTPERHKEISAEGGKNGTRSNRSTSVRNVES